MGEKFKYSYHTNPTISNTYLLILRTEIDFYKHLSINLEEIYVSAATKYFETIINYSGKGMDSAGLEKLAFYESCDFIEKKTDEVYMRLEESNFGIDGEVEKILREFDSANKD
jgi:hypothetical protein